MLPDELRRGGRHSRPDDTNSTTSSLLTWPEVYESAEQWVEWTARRRWPEFGANTQVWALSVTSWETHGQRAAA